MVKFLERNKERKAEIEDSRKKKGRKKKKLIIISVLAGVVCAASIFALAGKDDKGKLTYEEAEAAMQDISSYYSFDGVISSAETQTVYTPNLMTVDELYVSVGDLVEEGDLLVTYKQENSTALLQAQTSLSSAQLNLTTAKNNLDRIAALYEKGGVSMEEYESAQNSYTTAQLNLTQAQANYQSTEDSLEDYSVYAKVSGMVVSVSADSGEELNSGSEVMEIISYEDLEIEITIDEYDMSELSEGQEALITINSTGEQVSGYISELSRKATVQNGISYFSGTVKLNEGSDSVSVGTSAEVKITTSDAGEVLAVPVGAVQFNEELGAYVLVKDGSKMTETAVETGESNGIFVEILSGIKEGTVVMVPTYNNTSDENTDMSGGMPGGMVTMTPSGDMSGGRPSGGGMPGGF